VGAARERGTSMLIEDVACPVDKLGDMMIDLIEMFKNHGYDDASCFGHALEGNLHLVFSQVGVGVGVGACVWVGGVGTNAWEPGCRQPSLRWLLSHTCPHACGPPHALARVALYLNSLCLICVCGLIVQPCHGTR